MQRILGMAVGCDSHILYTSLALKGNQMIKEYSNGNELLEENREFLNTNKYLSAFFWLDGPLLTKADRVNYAMKCENGGKALVALKNEPYSLMLFGEKDLVPELIGYIVENRYELKNCLCASEVGYEFTKFLKDSYGYVYEEALAMDFMKCNEITEASSDEVETANANDLDEICELIGKFISDCGLVDKVNREKTLERISNFRIIRRDGLIVSMARLAPGSDEDKKISDVYTRDEYRGKGFARKVVNRVKNEILENSMTATLNVDRRNPISYHLYTSLGFKRVFSQGEFRRVR